MRDRDLMYRGWASSKVWDPISNRTKFSDWCVWFWYDNIILRLTTEKNLSTIRNNSKKSVKSRVTVSWCCIANGYDKTEPIIIAKFKKPGSFKGVEIKKRGILYAAKSNAWMTVIILVKWLHQFSLRMHGRKVLLLLDNDSSHKVQQELNNGNVVFSA